MSRKKTTKKKSEGIIVKEDVAYFEGSDNPIGVVYSEKGISVKEVPKECDYELEKSVVKEVSEKITNKAFGKTTTKKPSRKGRTSTRKP